MTPPPLATDWAEVLVPPIWSAILVVGLALLLVVFKRPVRYLLNELGISRLNILGIDIEGIADETESAYVKRRRDAPERGELQAFARLSEQLAPLVRFRRVLWVDDEPDNFEIEARLLRKLGVAIEIVPDTEGALAKLRSEAANFDLVISDWRRGDDHEAGRTLLEALRDEPRRWPVILYVGEVLPERRIAAAELGAKAITNEPDELLKQALVELAAAA